MNQRFCTPGCNWAKAPDSGLPPQLPASSSEPSGKPWDQICGSEDIEKYNTHYTQQEWRNTEKRCSDLKLVVI